MQKKHIRRGRENDPCVSHNYDLFENQLKGTMRESIKRLLVVTSVRSRCISILSTLCIIKLCSCILLHNNDKGRECKDRSDICQLI